MAGATLLDLTGLTDKSWLRVESSGRYDLHELVRQYCAEKLAAEHEREAGETPDQVHDRHCAYFASLAAPYERTFRPPRKSDRRELIPELDNLYIAWLRAIERRDAEQLRQLLPFADVNELLGRNRVMLQFFETSFEKLRKAWEQEQDTGRAPKTALILADLCWGKAGRFVSLDQWAEVLAATDTGLAFLERAERCALWQASFVFSRLLRALAISHLGEPAEADRLLCEVSGYLDQADARRWLTNPEVTLPRWRAWVNTFRANSLPRLGHYAESLRLNEEALAYHAETGHMVGFPMAWNGYIRSLKGDFGEARRRVQATLDAWQASGHGEMIGVASAFLAEIEAATGEVAPRASTSGAAWPSPAPLTAMDWCASVSKAWGGWNWRWGGRRGPLSCTASPSHSSSAPAWCATITPRSPWAGWDARRWHWAIGRKLKIASDGPCAARSTGCMTGSKRSPRWRRSSPWKGMSCALSSCSPSPSPIPPRLTGCANPWLGCWRSSRRSCRQSSSPPPSPVAGRGR